MMISSHGSPRVLLPNARFSTPATEAQIMRVDEALGVRLPETLRSLYRDCDGFREDRGNAKYLLSLTDDDVIGSLLTVTRFHWSGMPSDGARPDLRPFVFF